MACRAEQEQCDGEDHEKHQPSHRRRVAHLQVLKRREEHVQRKDQRRIDRSPFAVADDVNLREILHGGDHPHHEVKEDHRAEHRQRNVPQPLPIRGAVERRCFVELARDVVQRRQINDHKVARAPNAHQDQSVFRAEAPTCAPRERVRGFGRALKPVPTAETQVREQMVDQPLLRLKQPNPHHRRGHQRHNGRQVKQRSEHRLAAQLQVQ